MKTNLCQAQIPLNLCLAQLLCAATLAAAQSPSDFRSSAPVSPARGDALQRLTLPFEVYRDARPDLADIRIFNANGEAMPMAYAADPEPTREEPAAASLAMFPIFGAPRSEKGGEVGNVDLTVQSYRDGTIISLKTKNAVPAKDQRPIAWILDASAIKQPMRNLGVDWNTGKGLEIARITVDGSDDLKSWTPIASRAPVMAVVQGSERLVQRKVDLRGARYKYLRVSADPPAFQLVHAQVESDAVWRPATRLTRSVPGAAGAKAGEYVFDLGARLPVESVRLKLSEVNSVAPFRLLARDDPSKEGHVVASATFYRLFRDGFELESPPVNVGRVSSRYWIARLDARSPPPGGGPPTLEVQYRPAQVVFVARGDVPFTLAFGNPETQPSVLAVSQLIPGYERLAELKLQEAKVGAVTTGEIKGDWLRSVTGGTSPRKLALWAVLIAAVIALAFMAFRLAKQVNPGP